MAVRDALKGSAFNAIDDTLQYVRGYYCSLESTDWAGKVS